MDKAKKVKPYKKSDRVKGPGVIKSALLVTQNQAYVDLPGPTILCRMVPAQPMKPTIGDADMEDGEVRMLLKEKGKSPEVV